MTTAGSTISYGWTVGDGVAVGGRFADGSVSYSWTVGAAASSPKSASGSVSYTWTTLPAIADNGTQLPPDQKWRVAVQACRGGADSGPGAILTYDLEVTNLVINRNLSDGCDITCDVNPYDTASEGLYFKAWGQYIHIEKVMQGKRRLWCTGIVQPSDIDETTGILHLKAKGFAAYPKGIPWLEDINWLANDAFRPVVEIWRHIQEDFPNGQLDVTVYPQTSGVEMLPGYEFDGNLLNLDFFATFVRATDLLDCGDYINALARDIPFDYREESEWNSDRTDVIKRIHLGYPRLGVVQDTLAFVLNENVLTAKPHTETQTDWVSDVGVTGFFPGVQYSAELSNADPDRVRRYLPEDDAFIDSNERAAAWAHRRLARRQTPEYFETITINPDHPNAPMGSFDVGDDITVQGWMPWVGYIKQLHKIIAISVDVTKKTTQLTLYAEGAFNYDPIYYTGGVSNIIFNTGFDNSLEGWTASDPNWSWDATQGHSALGAAKIVADGATHDLLTQPFGISDFQVFPMSVYVKCSGAVGSGDAAQLVAQFYDESDSPTVAYEVAALTAPSGIVPWQQLAGNLVTPAGSSKVAMRLHIAASMTAGTIWFDDAVITI